MEWLKEDLLGEQSKPRHEKVRALKSVAAELGCSRAQLALAWCLRNPNVSSVITGASSAAQVGENMKALEVLPGLTDAVMARIETVLDNRPEPTPTYR